MLAPPAGGLSKLGDLKDLAAKAAFAAGFSGDGKHRQLWIEAGSKPGLFIGDDGFARKIEAQSGGANRFDGSFCVLSR
jgi:hypothetical protein